MGRRWLNRVDQQAFGCCILLSDLERLSKVGSTTRRKWSGRLDVGRVYIFSAVAVPELDKTLESFNLPCVLLIRASRWYLDTLYGSAMIVDHINPS